MPGGDANDGRGGAPASPPSAGGNGPDDGGAGPAAGQLDLTAPARGEELVAQEVPPYSLDWAKVVQPFTRAIFSMLTAVLLVPFIIVVWVDDPKTRGEALDWAKTILAPVVGFASAAIGYYYGTRQAGETAPRGGDEVEE